MLKFSGNISNECKSYIRKKERRSTLIAGSFSILILAYPCIALLSSLSNLISAIIMYLVIVVTFILVAFLTPTKADVEKLSPTEVSISIEDSYIASVCKMFTLDRDLSEIKAVIDHGDWYSFQFSGRGAPAQRFICQKDLMVQGTLQDFERLFAEKIVFQPNKDSK